VSAAAAQVAGLRSVQLEEPLGYLQHDAGYVALVMVSGGDDWRGREGECPRLACRG
jgi:hypothetical protein